MAGPILAMDQGMRVQGAQTKVAVGDVVVYVLSSYERGLSGGDTEMKEACTSRWSLPYLVAELKDNAATLKSFFGTRGHTRQVSLRHVRKLAWRRGPRVIEEAHRLELDSGL
eukprot:GHVQ01039451.1.p1 GENE.GHVQ01039451.1~~GHVQ01039451.1.p1  ORF type:complete len:112 (-),score=11.12 GHVQ01039451.1:1423-1758(-)